MSIRERVREAYSGVAVDPIGRHPFPCGVEFARSLGYPERLLEGLSGEVKDSFTGVSNVSVFAEIPKGSQVLDLGCGAGLDSFVALGKIGSSGRVVGVDFSKAMIEKAAAGLRGITAQNAAFVLGDGESLPLPDASFDIAMVNGIFNLNPSREQIFPELERILAPGGRVFAAELILKEPLPEAERGNEDNWFA